MSETVKLHVEIRIDYVDDAYDTGITVDEWNAMTPEQRSNERASAWTAAAENDMGGVWPITDNAQKD